MARIAWTDPDPVSGEVLTIDRWKQLKADISAQIGEVGGSSGNLDASNMVPGFVTRNLLAAGNRDVLHTVTCSFNEEALASDNRPGITAASGNKDRYGGVMRFSGTLIGVDYSIAKLDEPIVIQPMKDAGNTGTLATISGVSASTIAASASASKSTQTNIAETSFSAGDSFGIRLARSGSTDSKVTGLTATFYFRVSLI